MFAAPTYVVLDLPAPVSDDVSALRKRYDRKTARLPAEITIAGSSGIGVLSPFQQPEHVFEVIERVGRSSLPFVTSFVEISKFPNVPIFWLRPKDRKPFDALQLALVAADLRFEPNRFEYVPHCTISMSPDLTDAQLNALCSETFPREEFSLSRMSVYQPTEEGAKLMWSVSV